MENETQGEYREQKFDFLRLWYALRRRYWIFISVFFVIMLSTLVHTLQQTPVFQATTTLIIEPNIPKVVEFDNLSSMNYAFLKEFYETQFNIIRSRKVIRQTLEILGLYDLEKDKEGTDQVEEFLANVSVDPLKNTNLVKISVDNPDAEQAAKEANTLARVYIQYNLEDRKTASKDAFTWLSEQISILKSKVEKSEYELLKYKQDEDIISIEERQSLIEKRMDERNESYNKALAQRTELETMLGEIRDLMTKPEILNSLPKIFENSLTQELKLSHSNLQGQLAELSTKYKAKHPKILSLQSQIANIESRLVSEIEKVSRGIEIEIRISKANEKIIGQTLDSLKQESLHLSQQAIQYSVLKREAESNKNMYDVLLYRMKETDITGNINANNVRVVDEAIVPKEPYKPKKKQTMVLAILVGTALGLLLVILLDYLDNTIKTEEDVNLYLKETIIGVIPKEKNDLVVGFEGSESMNRYYREMKTNLSFYRQEHVLNTLLVTSSIKGEGKTTSVIFLGKAFAQSGMKVLLIDTDMFYPRLSKRLKIDSKIGLSDVFLHNTSVQEIIAETPFENLFIIPAGLIPPSPSELIGSDKLKKLIETVKDDFDIVIIDSPPVTATFEVAALGSFVDGILVAVKANGASLPIIKRSLSELKSLKGNILGTILTSINPIDRHGYYYYGYYYGKPEEDEKS
ncbi:polysaccharide biosynthesis tyrosine autokinase [bacterium]|nr:polysaccharide biosynthesis tyrosine autokinase [bacterium]